MWYIPFSWDPSWLVILILFGKERKTRRSSLCSFLLSHVTCIVAGPNYFSVPCFWSSSAYVVSLMWVRKQQCTKCSSCALKVLIMVILQQGQRWTCGKDWRDEKLVFFFFIRCCFVRYCIQHIKVAFIPLCRMTLLVTIIPHIQICSVFLAHFMNEVVLFYNGQI